MTNKDNSRNTTVNLSELNYPYPYFVPIADDDEETIRFYKMNCVPVTYIALPGRLKRYYAVFSADSQEEADLMNRQYNNWAKQDERREKKKREYETSYDELLEKGYEPEDESNNPESITENKDVYIALVNALGNLTEEALRICSMIANGESQRKVAAELNIPRTTLEYRTKKLLSELRVKLDK